ncbi:hypothetical protein VT84_07285 [Gemmata sp. SH-PL17]|uniref:hypothetical protein n=1 Tax=Gemmata sp. SH-PL17 TaxID=1630693 RepID=UPI00078D9367|nr:hypothetical protein [Gemmata sp. SH-PL17]AMV24183.1 hypothetical protein VT84_07285 [Gemmata sp. SH-PL17]
MAQVRASWGELVIPDPVPFGPGCPPGGVGATFPTFPDLGTATACTDGTCGSGAPVTPLLYRWLPLCRGQLNASAPPGAVPVFNSPVLDQATKMLDRWRREVAPPIPGLDAGPARVNPGGGHITLALGPPDEGPVVLPVALVYNSRRPGPGEAGYGWTVFPKSAITSITSTALDLATGDGTVLRYNGKDPDEQYRTPGARPTPWRATRPRAPGPGPRPTGPRSITPRPGARTTCPPPGGTGGP